MKPEPHFTGSKSAEQYKVAVDSIDEIFQHAAEIDCKLSFLDLGGGFPESDEVLNRMAVGVLESVKKFTQKYAGVTVVAEPGILCCTNLGPAEVEECPCNEGF